MCGQGTIKRLEVVRDIFLFSCYNGFAYVDVANLTTDHINIGIDGKKWLIKPRQKTGISEIVPIFPPALRILNKYENDIKLRIAKNYYRYPQIKR